jgi:ActR/RegA family two-component response regulator
MVKFPWKGWDTVDIKPMRLVLIEDDDAECARFKECANSRADITFVAVTGSSTEGLKYVKTRLPEGVILDLELHRGEGFGLQFLEKLKDVHLGLRPIIAIATNIRSDVVYSRAHDLGADVVFCKKQQDYNPDMVINALISLRNSRQRDGSGTLNIECSEDRRNRIYERIDRELNLIGIPIRLKGRAYIRDAIFLIVECEDPSEVLYKVASNRKIGYNAVFSAMKTAIDRAWTSTSIEDLEKYYTACIDIHAGTPYPTEMILYYGEKIRKSID